MSSYPTYASGEIREGNSPLTLTGAVSALAFFVIIASGCIDLFGGLKLASFSVQAVLTIAYLFSAIVLLIAIPTRALIPVRSVPFFLFVAWGICSLAWTPAAFNGAQNLLVILNLLVLSLVAESTARIDQAFAARVDAFLRWAVGLAVVGYFASMVVFGWGTSDVIGARTFSLFALFGVAQQLARWRYVSPWGFFWAVVFAVVIGISQSRLSLGIAVVMFPLAQWPTRDFRKVFKMVAVGLAAIGLAVFSIYYFDALRERFFAGDVSLKVGDFAINGSGRRAFWDATVTSFLEAPIIGKGAGSAQFLVESVFVSMGHPHSDYIRVAHDYGIIGSALWLICLGSWFVGHYRYWQTADRAAAKTASLHLTALLSLIGFLVQMLMENTLVYVFIAAPLGLILGAAAGSGALRSRFRP